MPYLLNRVEVSDCVDEERGESLEIRLCGLLNMDSRMTRRTDREESVHTGLGKENETTNFLFDFLLRRL
jgi:hypothetical protein